MGNGDENLTATCGNLTRTCVCGYPLDTASRTLNSTDLTSAVSTSTLAIQRHSISYPNCFPVQLPISASVNPLFQVCCLDIQRMFSSASPLVSSPSSDLKTIPSRLNAKYAIPLSVPAPVTSTPTLFMPSSPTPPTPAVLCITSAQGRLERRHSQIGEHSSHPSECTNYLERNHLK